MRFNAALTSALVSSATLLGYAHAEESGETPDSTSSLVERPAFTVCCTLPSLHTAFFTLLT